MTIKMASIQSVAEQAARAAGDLIRRASGNISALNIQQKSLHDYVSEVDRGAEKTIIETIRASFSDHQIVGEEYGTQGPDSATYQWIVDPLDGTTNFLRGIPHYAVSIGVTEHGQLLHGVVYDVAKDEFFCATKGHGAALNGVGIRVSDGAGIAGALLATGVPFSGENLRKLSSFTNTMTVLLEAQTSGIRRFGAAALDLAYVACGRYDGFWEANLKSWDIAAGVLLVQEAGGQVSDLQGRFSYLTTGNVLAANPGTYRDMLAVTSSCYR